MYSVAEDAIRLCEPSRIQRLPAVRSRILSEVARLDCWWGSPRTISLLIRWDGRQRNAIECGRWSRAITAGFLRPVACDRLLGPSRDCVGVGTGRTRSGRCSMRSQQRSATTTWGIERARDRAKAAWGTLGLAQESEGVALCDLWSWSRVERISCTGSRKERPMHAVEVVVPLVAVGVGVGAASALCSDTILGPERRLYPPIGGGDPGRAEQEIPHARRCHIGRRGR